MYIYIERENERVERQVILVVALPNATVGQKAMVGQGLPNSQCFGRFL